MSLTSSMLLLDTLRKYGYQSEYFNNTILPMIVPRSWAAVRNKGNTFVFGSKDVASMV